MKERLGLRFIKSLYTRSYVDLDIINWIRERRTQISYNFNEIALKDLDGWKFDDNQISHNSGKFFQIQYRENKMNGVEWDQPMINQPEIGILGFIVKEIEGVLHFLVQAKIEPGNINIVQLSPTVQSTKSNFTKVHGGSSTPFVEYFLNGESEILIDQLQSEQGSRFYQKRNRNIIIEVEDTIIHDNYIWMTLGDLVAMSKHNNMVNMDSRTVISCIHFGSYDYRNFEVAQYMGLGDSPWMQSMLRRDVYQNSIPKILSKITEHKFRRDISTKLISFNDAKDWNYSNGRITHKNNKFFDVIGYHIFIDSRESKSWNQPLIKPKNHGVCCFFAKNINGVYHLLVHLKDEIGSFDGVEMAPTIQTSAENFKSSMFYKIYQETSNEDILLDVMQSEEGGRFFEEQNRNMIIDIRDRDIPEHRDYIWMTVHQIKTFLQYNNYVNIQTRSIISSLPL